MSYLVLARKWRPRKFAELVGQQHVVRALGNALSHDRLHHAYLFSGTRGVGKTTIARIFARSLNCETGVTPTPCGVCSACTEIDEGRFVDLIEVDAASRTGVDDTRELIENVQYAPTRGRYKVYLIDEVHMFSRNAFNALLKTLEEPPPHIKFLLATTDPKKLPITILSRCLQFHLRRLAPDEIEAQLERIATAESIPAEPPALRLVAHAADGSLRDALSLLDQAIAYGAGRLVEAEVAAMLGTIDRERVFALAGGLADGDAAGLLGSVRELAELGADFHGVLGELLAVLQAVAVRQALGGAAPDDDPRVAALAARIEPADCQLWYQIGLLGRRDLPLAPDARGGFEMTLLRMLAFRPGAQPALPGAGAGTGAAAPPAPRPAAVAAPATVARPAVPAPAVAPASPIATPPHPAGAAVAAGDADDPWQALIDRLALTGLVRELAANCVHAGRDGDAFRLLLSPRCAQLRNARREKQLEEQLRAHFGPELRLQLEVGELAGAETPTERQARQEREREARAQVAIESDPNVQVILARFDARVESTSPLPAGGADDA